MRKCPFCLFEIPEEARVCKSCNSTIVKKCTACNAEILATAKKCRYCAADLDAPLPVAQPLAVLPDRPCGERREIVLQLLLFFLTCGIWGLVLQYRIGSDLNTHQTKTRLNPGMDLLLIFVTCGLWVFYIMAKYPQVMTEMIRDEGRNCSDLVLPSILFTLFGFHVVALLLLQSELNDHWKHHALQG
ncbi:MAG TPA: DUF4234 domain-containing protein [Planctomycetota bacterium]|nr:DUF4234 domain-containing protein [Planctomycetota bacterium]